MKGTPQDSKKPEMQAENTVFDQKPTLTSEDLGEFAVQEATKVNAAISKTDAPKSVEKRRERNTEFTTLTNQDLRNLAEIVGEENVLIDSDEISFYTIDITRKFSGLGSVVVTPRTTEQVSECLKYCNERMIAVVPQGGNTGLVGGGVPVHDEVVVSTKKMNNIIDFDPVQGTLTCQAGCILETLQNYCKDLGYMMPLDLGAKGSCQIGGNLATNAGGIKFIKQGSMHANCIGLEVVLADGTIIDQMNPHQVTPGGYDMK